MKALVSFMYRFNRDSALYWTVSMTTTVADFSQAGLSRDDVEGEICRSTRQLQSGIVTDKSILECDFM